MEEETKFKIVLAFALVALIFAATSIVTPWWVIGTTPEYELELNTTGTHASYSLFQQVSATSGNLSVTVSFTNMTSEENAKPLAELCSLTSTLTTIGLVFNVLTVILIYLMFTRNERMLKFAKITAVISALIFLAATIYFQSEFATRISNFDSVIPTAMLETPIQGSKISGFWGGIEMSSGLFEWTWSAGFGWYSAFTAFVFSAMLYILVNSFFKKKE